jgi:hypothetical protein
MSFQNLDSQEQKRFSILIDQSAIANRQSSIRILWTGARSVNASMKNSPNAEVGCALHTIATENGRAMARR